MFEEAGYSLLGPMAMNISAPDEGNMHLIEAVATPEQKERWLRPLARGEIRSCFCMTEPPPGAGAIRMLAHAAVQDGNHWVINGEKWFITGAAAPDSRSSWPSARDGTGDDVPGGHGYAPGIEVVRAMDSLDQGFPGGHCVVRFDDLRVPATDILGEARQRLSLRAGPTGPGAADPLHALARAAGRAHEVASDYARRRQVFGEALGNHEGVGFMLADNEMDIRMARLAIWHTAWVLDQGRARRHRIRRRQGGMLRGDLARRRSLRADHGRPGRHRRDPRGAHLPRSARLSHLRRALRSASLEPGTEGHA